MARSVSAIIDRRIVLIRGQRVMIDADLALVHGVTTKALNQATKRNRARFPSDFLFRLTALERNKVVTDCDHLSHLRFSAVRPHAFTEHGAIMAASILNSPRAIEMSVYVVRAFLRLRELSLGHAELAAKVVAIELKVGRHDRELNQVFDAIRGLITGPRPSRRAIGFAPSRDV